MTFTEPPDWHQHAACLGTDPNGETIGVWGGTSERERRAMRSAIIGYVRPARWTGGPDAQRTPSPPRACTWPDGEFVSSPSGTGSHMAAHRRRTDGAA